jgi:hypothetical protein
VSTYRVRCRWSDAGWTVTCVEQPTIRARCRRLDQVEHAVVEAAHLSTGETRHDIEVEIVEVTGPSVVRAASRVGRKRAAAAEALRAAERERDELVDDLHREGLTLKDIGRITGMSFQRAQKLLTPPQLPEGELLDRFAACELLGCSPRTLSRLVESGKLQGQVIGPRTRRYYSRAGIEDYLARSGSRPGNHDLPAPQVPDGPGRYLLRGGRRRGNDDLLAPQVPDGRGLRVPDDATVRRLVAAGELLDGLGACRLLGCSPAGLRKRVAAGEVSGQVMGPRTRRYYTREGLEQYLASRPQRDRIASATVELPRPGPARE